MGRACRGKERSDWQRSLQDGGACGNHTGSPLAWHDALAFRGRSPCVTKSAMHRLVFFVLKPSWQCFSQNPEPKTLNSKGAKRPNCPEGTLKRA